ncbi:MAG: HNH endonuclease signature motif containing protein [Verrucomicrobia bacterium]|nr:HNH endonuclease signature motif containing protein [Verrucomicrobiota bacterium]
MPFTEALKTKVKKKAHFTCCMCKAMCVEVHHIVPQDKKGPDTEDNAAPLCPSCHETYGANPQKRKLIREMRDAWYEICEKRFSSDTHQLRGISEVLKSVATKKDLERLSVQNSAYMLGQPSAGSQPFWEHLRYSFVREEYIHPLIVRELLGWISDPHETVVAIDLAQANHSNRFFGDFSARSQGPRLWVEWRNDQRESFAYSHIATSPSGVHMVECHYCGGGSGVFGLISLLGFDFDRALYEKHSGTMLSTERILLKTFGSVGLGDRYSGEIKYHDGLLIVGPDEGWFKRGKEACRQIPVR